MYHLCEDFVVIVLPIGKIQGTNETHTVWTLMTVRWLPAFSAAQLLSTTPALLSTMASNELLVGF